MTPDRGDSVGGTRLEITLENNPLTAPEHAGLIQCRFSSAVAGDSGPAPAIAYAPATLIDEGRLGCVAPDFSAAFTPAPSSSTVQEVHLSVAELDGTFRVRSELRFRYFARPEIHELSPSKGFATRLTQVRAVGRNFLNFEDLAVRAIGVPADGADRVELTWRGSQVLLTDPGTLLLEMPAASTPLGRRTGSARSVRLEVSLNGEADWTTGPAADPPLFTFLDEPQVVSLSHLWSNLRGGFPLTLQILHLGFRAGCEVPAEMPACAQPTDVAYCRIGVAETVLRHQNETHAECLVPPQAEEMAAPVALVTVGGQYFGVGNQRGAATLTYAEGTRITAVVPAEGPADGGQLVSIVGDFARIPASDSVDVEIGGLPVLELVGRTDSAVIVRVPAVTLLPGETERSVTVAFLWERTGLRFLNESVRYSYRAYPTLLRVWPTHGPGAGGTLLELHGIGLDQRGLCRLESSSGEVLLVRPLWTSPELLLCEAPRHAPEVLALELAFAEGPDGAFAHTTTSGLTFRYDADAHLLSCNASHFALSAHREGVRIGAAGLHFLDTPDLAVKVGDWVTPATYVNASYLVFTAPPVREAGRYTVALTSNAADFAVASSPVSLTFHGGFAVESLSLSKVQVVEGSTLSLTARGRGLPVASEADSVDFFCVLTPGPGAPSF